MIGEHEWPDELTSDAKCQRCGLEYGAWSDPETLYCTGD